MGDVNWGATPARWEAQYRLGLLGRGWWTVNMNNHTDTGCYDEQASAQLEAARMNYQNGSYYRPTQFGMDGLP